MSLTEEQRNKGQDVIKTLDLQKMKIIEEADVRHKEREMELEKEIEEKTRDFEENIKDV